MGQRNEIETHARALSPGPAPHVILQSRVLDELFDGEFPHGKNQTRFEHPDLRFQPGCAGRDLLFVRNAIASLRLLSGKATTDRRHVDMTAKSRFTQSRALIEPLEESLPRRPRERTPEFGFFVTRRLTNQKNRTENGAATDRGPVHVRAKFTRVEVTDVSLQLLFERSRCRASGPGAPLPLGIRHRAKVADRRTRGSFGIYSGIDVIPGSIIQMSEWNSR